MRIRILLVTAFLALAACGPMMETSYEVRPPETIEGRQCANQCLGMKQSCEAACRQDVNACENMNLIEAQTKYIVDHAANKTSDKTPDDFQGSRYCSADACMASCNDNFNICHTNCGGQVIPHTQCTAFCD